MTTPFSRATAGALATVRKVAGATVTYKRGSLSAPVTAVKGTSQFEAETGDGITNEFESVDWLIEAVALAAAGFEGEPQRGDLVDDGGITYEVLPESVAPVFDFSDRDRTTFRIHTKRVDE